ncbi:hypothetical protein ABE607_09625 [Comamonas aquatica]|jgi:hypothetical protein|uniref:Uncharacterized protein n=1 Tax=Comamonas aquatica TaxID=225991 RepID=A0AA42HZ16_9BURK|nr:hypothetical protein [Comamonas aquatica]MDH0364282.1 hypothetical protein [Comamonas aquatica]MDH1675524.1 hypothetical protein [Comamonas aquatica]MDH1678919.1 hypothetical protein [Comamonas aquatica]MDH1903347.1 hypothetical protein [Comamonas aquatica]WBM40918.1 hypothetical protein M2J84_12290 [Comamonas aquatica]
MNTNKHDIPEELLSLANRRLPVFESHLALESNSEDRRLEVEKRFTEEQIAAFLR